MSENEINMSKIREFYDKNSIYINQMIGYTMLSMLVFNMIDFTFLFNLYFVGLAYITAIENNRLMTQDTVSDNTKKIVNGWTSFCAIIIFDGAMSWVDATMLSFIIRLIRIMMYLVYTQIFIKYIEERREDIHIIQNELRDNYMMVEKENDKMQNIFERMFVKLIIINNRMMHYVCIEMNIMLLQYINNNIIINNMINLYKYINENGIYNTSKILFNNKIMEYLVFKPYERLNLYINPKTD